MTLVSKRPWIGLTTVALCLAVVAAFLVGDGSRGLAQDEADEAEEVNGRPVVLLAGSCGDDDLGDEVATLSDLTPFDGETVGQEAAIAAESSYTNVPLLPEDFQADDHVINAAAGADDDASIVCGEIGGPLSPNGTLIIGMREQNGSGFAGVAYLSPGADGASTDVSVFVAEGLLGASDDGRTEEDDTGTGLATPVAIGSSSPEPRRVRRSSEDAEPAEDAESVAVSLVEWSVDLPTELDAGLIAFEAANDGSVRHSLAIEGDGVDERLEGNLQPGESGTLEVDLDEGTYVAYCPVGNHRGRGMETEIEVG